MLKKFHIEICQRALASNFSSRALEVIITANLGQDHIRYQVRHPHFHFDSNAFGAGNHYIHQQRQIVLEILHARKDLKTAWKAFGRLTHTVQDFYAHTNYIQLWVDAYSNGNAPSLTQVGAMDPKILQHPDLHSGNVYFWDWLAFVPGFYNFAHRLTPDDSHTHMNLDSPDRGPLFPYAFEAAVKRTVYELEQVVEKLNDPEIARFADR